MRLFIAITISEDVKNYLVDIQKTFLGTGNFNFVNDFHLTLKFLGDVDEAEIENLDNLLNEIKYNKFELSLNRLGAFPNINDARVLWIDVIGDVQGLWKLIENKLKKDFGSENRFKEHITLARIKQIDNKELFFKKLEIDTKKIKFNVVDFRLIKSELKINGPVYTDMKVYLL